MPRSDMTLYGSPILRQVAEPVNEITDEVKEIAEKLKKVLAKQNGVGLAAPQIGISKRIFLVDLTKAEEKKTVVLLNPEIVSKSQETTVYEEGCLSVPEVWGDVVRPARIKIRGTLLNGNSIVIKAEGFYARALQHEFDHLDGKLFIDYLSEADIAKNRDKLDALLKEAEKKYGEAAK